MARAAVVACLALGGAAAASWASKYSGVANPDAVVQRGSVRFTVLTPAVIRMEYAVEGEFDDAPSVAFVNRYFADVPEFAVTEADGVLRITTSHVEVTYDPQADVSVPVGVDGSERAAHPAFAPGRLRAKLLVEPHSAWTPGTPNTGNLHGTFRTLDRVADPVGLACPPVTNFYIYYSHCEEGLVSRDGWVLVEDTLRPRLSLDIDGRGTAWPVSPNPRSLKNDGGYIDWYLFAHGLDYKAALGDFVKLSGPIPLSPRYALGPAFSRWYQWSDIENLEIVQAGFADNGIPLDVLVVDMDWHYTYPRGLPNAYGVQVEGWTGHTVYPYLFPEPSHFLSYLRRRNVFVTFNHHPAAGIEFHEEVYPAFARALGRDPAAGATIDFDIANHTWSNQYFKHVISPIDDLGMEYWWLDFQQQPFTSVPLLNPTIMCNYAWWNNPYRYGALAPAAKARDRPFLMGRFGGLGAHRYPIGFVGDTYVKWDVLRFETYFMPTASNVGYQWTHDIGGFEGYSPPEFFTRHLQFGTFSPALRTHSSKRSTARSIWTYPYVIQADRRPHSSSAQAYHVCHICRQPYFSVMKRFYRLRTRLVPYIATAQRIAYDTGLPVVRPMYYEYPKAPQAYTDQGLHQYFFGDDIWVAPIAAAGSLSAFNVSGVPVTNWTVWVPPGKWIEWFSYEAVSAPAPHGGFIARNFSIHEAPIYSRPGAIIPMRTLPRGNSVLGLSSQVPRELTFTVFGGVELGAGRSATTSTRLYDDDGGTVAYQGSAFSFTPVSCTWTRSSSKSESDTLSCHIALPEGSREHLPSSRVYTWRFVGTYPPQSVAVNGEEVALDSLGTPDAYGEDAAWVEGVDAWGYEGSTLSTWVHLGAARSLDEPLTLTLTFAPGVHVDDKRLTTGLYRKVQRVLACKDGIDKVYGALFPSDVEPMLNVSAAVGRLSAHADGVYTKQVLSSIPGYLVEGLKLAKSWRIPEGHKVKRTQQRCIMALTDAAAAPTVLDATHPLYAAADSELTYKYAIGEHMTAPEPPATDAMEALGA